MGHVMVGYTVDNLTAGAGAQPLAGANGQGSDGPINVLIIAEDAGIFIGNDDVAAGLPNSGYELTPGQEYRFTFHGDGAHVATTSVSNVTYRAFVSPHVA